VYFFPAYDTALLLVPLGAEWFPVVLKNQADFGSLVVTDLGSKFGTSVDEESCPAQTPVTIKERSATLSLGPKVKIRWGSEPFFFQASVTLPRLKMCPDIRLNHSIVYERLVLCFATVGAEDKATATSIAKSHGTIQSLANGRRRCVRGTYWQARFVMIGIPITKDWNQATHVIIPAIFTKTYVAKVFLSLLVGKPLVNMAYLAALDEFLKSNVGPVQLPNPFDNKWVARSPTFNLFFLSLSYVHGS
jgi:hypothetical protein